MAVSLFLLLPLWFPALESSLCRYGVESLQFKSSPKLKVLKNDKLILKSLLYDQI